MIKTLIQTWLAPYETYLWAALAVALMVSGLYFVHHERVIGEEKVIAADARARATLEAKVAKQTAALQAKADQAEKDRVATQKSLDDYMSAHPIGAVLVCGDPRRGSAGVQKAPAPAASTGGPSPGPAVVPEVPGRSAPRDIGPALDTLVRAAGAMAGLYSETQADYVNAQR